MSNKLLTHNMDGAAQSSQNPTLVQEQPPQMCNILDAEAQSAQCEKPNLPSSCDAVFTPACTSSDDAAYVTTPDSEDAALFSIRGYTAAVREINISKCWPFSWQLLQESIREGKHPLLPPLSPCACKVQVSPEYYQDGTGPDSAQEDIGKACGTTDGPQLQVQIDLSKCDTEVDSHGCDAATCSPAKSLTFSLETAPLQELQEPCLSLLKEEVAKHGSSFEECPLVFKRQAPRSIREIRNSVMQGCECFKMMGAAQACRKGFCSKPSMRPPTADIKSSSLEASDEHFQDEQLGVLYKKGSGDHDNDSGITQLEPQRVVSYESQDVAYSQGGSSPPTEGMQIDVNYTNEQPVMLAASVPPTAEVDVCETTVHVHVYTRGDNKYRRCSVSDSQSVDKSPESHKLRSGHLRQCWDTTIQQESPDSTTCSDTLLQQTCPVCLLFQSSSNTALNVHIDRCLAASSMEEGTTKSKQKVKMRKKRSMAELCLIAPSTIVGGEKTNESTISNCNIMSQNPSSKAAVENKDKTINKQNQIGMPKSEVNTFKLLQWGSKSSSRHGASKRGTIQEAKTLSMKNQSFQGKTLEWRATSMPRNTRKWKQLKTDHEPVAELSKKIQDAPDERTRKLKKLIQRNKEVQNQNTRNDANPKGMSASQSIINIVSNKLHGRLLSKHKTAVLRAVLQSGNEKHSSRTSKATSRVLTSETHLPVIGPRKSTVEVLHPGNEVNAELDQGADKTQEKVKLQRHIHPTRKHENKRMDKARASLEEALDLELVAIKFPSVTQKVCNAECQSVRPDSPFEQHPMQGHFGIAEGSLEPEMLSQPKFFGKEFTSPRKSRRIEEESSVQDPSLPLLSDMMLDHQGERGTTSNSRKVQMSSTHSSAPPCLNCNDRQFNKSGVIGRFKDTNGVDVSLLPLGAQPNSEMSLRKNPAAFVAGTCHSQQKETEQSQVINSQQAQVSRFLSTAIPNNKSLLMQQFGRFPFSISTTETPWQPRQFEEHNFVTPGPEGLHSSVPFRFIQSLEAAKKTFGTTFPSQDLGAQQESPIHDACMMHAGQQISILQRNAEAHQKDPGSIQQIFHKDLGSAQNPSIPGGSSGSMWQTHHHSQRLPPWMEAAIHDQRSPAFPSVGLPTKSSCQSLLSNTTPSSSPELSRTLSMLETIGSPVIRLMGKTMVLTPDASQGHADINTGQLSGHSTYINFFQSLGPEEATYQAQNQLNRNQTQNSQMQPGIQPEYPASDEFICRSREVQSLETSESRPIPQRQDFFHKAPSWSQILSAHQPTISPNTTTNVGEQNQPTHSQLLSAMCQKPQQTWQHQKATNAPCLWSQSSSCCPRNQMRTNLEFSSSGLGECSSFRANLTLPQPRHNSPHNANDVKTQNSNLPSWFSSTINRINTSRQPATIRILDEENSMCSLNMSASGPLGRSIAAHSKRPAVSAAQQNGMPKSGVSYRAAREKPKEKAFIPIIYTVDGNPGELPIIPAIIGPNELRSITNAHEQSQVKSYGAATNPRKRVSCVEQCKDGAKHMKIGESTAPASNVNSRMDHGKACRLGPSEPPNCTVGPTSCINAFRAASQWMQNSALKGSISVSERCNGRKLPSSRCPEQNMVQGQKDSNVSKENRLDAPEVGMCSINMNPAEVDCQDVGQFTVTPTLDVISEPSPANDIQACKDANVSVSLHSPHAPIQKPRWPLSRSTVLPCVLPVSTSHPCQNIALQSLNKKAASKEKSSLPVVYDSSTLPSFLVTIPLVNRPYPLLSEGMAQECASPAIQPSLQASALSQEMQSFTAARKFVLMNGRVSIMDTQRNKGLVHENVMQKDRRSTH